MKVSQLSASEYANYYSNYIKKAGSEELISGLDSSLSSVIAFFKAIPKDKLEYRYETGKWSVKDIIQHLIDTERVFAYRALRFAREDKTALPGFKQNAYGVKANANKKSGEELLKEYQLVRESTIMLFKSFNEETLKIIGVASGSDMSVRAIGFVIIGHEKHHCQVIKERYL